MMNDELITLAATEYENALLSALSETEWETHNFSPKFEEKMEKLRKNVHRKRDFAALKRVAIIALISALLAGSLALTNPTVRASVYGWLKTHFESVFIYIDGKPSQNVPWEYEITWFPDDYTLASQEPAPDGHTLVYTCAGKPDIVFIGKKVAVFCDSEFWHGYNWEERKKDFKSHQEFWIPKIERNMERDVEVTARLEYEGWTVIRFWGNEIKKNAVGCADIIEAAYKEKY
mgnify:CR=1 FL=1